MRVLLISLLITGCSSIAQHPIEISCTGKGQISGNAYAGPVGAANNFQIQADCGEGFTYKSGPAK